ncbi:GNAT family N-acetyltransferase [Roseibium sp. M-1]
MDLAALDLPPPPGANTLPLRARAAAHAIAYRELRRDDFPFLLALYRSTREEELARTPWGEAEKHAFISMQFEAQHTHYRTHYPDALWLIIEAHDTPVGRLYLERWNREHRIIDIALMPQARGQGIGGAILADLINEAGDAGKSLGIHVEKANPAMRLYKRLGFQTREDKGVYDLLSHPCTTKA